MRLVKHKGIEEHVAHISHCRGVPLIQRLVEAPSCIKHGLHRGHLRGVPATHGLTEWLHACGPSPMRKIHLVPQFLLTLDPAF